MTNFTQDEQETPFCYVSSDPIMSSLYSVYNCLSVSLQYLIPLLVISYSYVRVALRLWWSVTPGHRSHSTVTQDRQNLNKKKKAVVMLVTVVIIFSLCWLPYHVYFLASMSQPTVNQFKYINLIFLISHWLAMSNSCCNPFIYCICSPTFRLYIKYTSSCSSLNPF